MPLREPTDGDDSPTNIVDKEESPEAGQKAHLVGLWGGAQGGSLFFELPETGTLFVGRSPGTAEVRLDHDSVSRRHARLHVNHGDVRIEDLRSANGTWLAGQRLPSDVPVPMPVGVPVEVGTAVLLLVRSGSAPLVRVGQPLALRDPQMIRVSGVVDVVAKSKLSVLLIGDTGVGKERLAAQLHEASRRASGPFIKVNCAALVESLLEAELFGHERGAFTGASQAKAGLVEAAHGGTLFLDEVGDMPLSTQAKVLRFLESGEVTRVGSVTPRIVDVRIVAATNVDLRALVEEGRFRRDLYFRLDGATIFVPPLRDRPGDVAPLAQSFADEACVEAGRTPVRLTDDALARLATHDWPGNVRELRNVIARSVLFCPEGTLSGADLRFDSVSGKNVSSRPLSAADEAERRRIVDALDRSAHNQTRAAKLLGISRRTLLSRLDALGMPRPRKDQ